MIFLNLYLTLTHTSLMTREAVINLNLPCISLYLYIRLSIFSGIQFFFFFGAIVTEISFCLIGEVVSLPFPHTITSIWPLPFGLLLQQEVEANIPSHVPFSSTSPLLNTRDMLHSASNHIQKGEGTSVSSHLILMDPLDELRVC